MNPAAPDCTYPSQTGTAPVAASATPPPTTRSALACSVSSLSSVRGQIHQSSDLLTSWKLTHLQLLLVLTRHIQNLLHVFLETELLQRLLDVIARYSLLRFLLGDVVGFGGYEGYEFDAAFDQEVAGIFGECEAGAGGEDLGYDLLDRCCVISFRVSVLFTQVCGESNESTLRYKRSRTSRDSPQ